MKLSLVLVGCVAIAGLAFACTGPDRNFVSAGSSDPTASTGATMDGGGGTGPDGGGMGPQKCTQGSTCGSGVCSDGFCCDRDCSSQCEACDVSGSEGKCTFVTGTPHPPRDVCDGSGTCAGVCNGTSKSCVFPSNAAICGAACDGTCDGQGMCSDSKPGMCPNGFGCGPSGCLTKCAQNTDCQQFFTCNASHACERVPESDCLDGVDNNGDGLADCANPTCAPEVECVEVPPSGELGEHITSGACPAHYDAVEEPYHTGLQPEVCTGCTCATNCSATYHLHTGSNCVGAPLNFTLTGVPNQFANIPCVDVPNQTYLSGTLDPAVVGTCTGSGVASQAAPTWATNDTFCVAKTSATCGDGSHVCVAKRVGAPLCARMDPANQCPANYDTTDTTLFTDFQAGSCGSCSSCTPANSLTCTNVAITDQALTGASCSGAGSPVDSGCSPLTRGAYASVEAGFQTSGVDNCKPNLSDTPPQTTGPTHVCCAAQ